jgi:hypothetical protein
MDAMKSTASAAATAATATATPRVSHSCGAYSCLQLDAFDLTFQQFLLEQCAKSVIRAKVDNGGLPQGFMTKILIKLHQNPLTVGTTRDHVNNMVCKMEQEASPISSNEDSNTSTVIVEESPTKVITVNQCGCPKGSSNASKHEI